MVHGDKELLEKLGRNDLCPCGSARRFQEVLHEVRRPRWLQPPRLLSGSDAGIRSGDRARPLPRSD
ncbi:SEC-C metal-binding domain-containing protein [Longimicrobium sp.]|uniref:SEC-C metal-binding domain-containing protein n=1 Tax=Longimicrobium sp. TaxID=2029185 RepID=UPI003B3A9B6A